MESTRILAAPGIRTAAYPGWRARLGMALTSVIDRPSLWLFGILGFCLRGGIALLTLPIIVLPTPVEVRLLLGDYLGTSGFSQRFWVESAVVVLVAAAGTLVVLAIVSRLEIAAFARLPLVDAEQARHLSRTAFGPVLGVQFLGFVAILFAVAPLITGAIETSYAEIVRPTSSAPIYERVVSALGPQILLFIAAIVVVEVISALTTREVLARSMRKTLPGAADPLLLLRALGAALGRLVRSPIRTLRTAVIGWIVTAGLIAPGLGVVVLAWAGTRAVFLSSVSFADLGEDIGIFVMAVALAAAFSVALALGGFASALRAAAWSVDRLR